MYDSGPTDRRTMLTGHLQMTEEEHLRESGRTPAYDSGRTPAYEGSRTPSYDETAAASASWRGDSSDDEGCPRNETEMPEMTSPRIRMNCNTAVRSGLEPNGQEEGYDGHEGYDGYFMEFDQHSKSIVKPIGQERADQLRSPVVSSEGYNEWETANKRDDVQKDTKKNSESWSRTAEQRKSKEQYPRNVQQSVAAEDAPETEDTGGVQEQQHAIAECTFEGRQCNELSFTKGLFT
ncbi:hypothetical protein TELCIR_06516 [Teladorsagia circumcincta]|uniref:Uncharacterized protein n=1 Tax=Teladorsagia circumcincta TaxID=45464 RepID=A0A2G9UQ38_TELCI|nr:hypothetical protein TELCIR_06516 [Teladorsagia circumcincta]